MRFHTGRTCRLSNHAGSSFFSWTIELVANRSQLLAVNVVVSPARVLDLAQGFVGLGKRSVPDTAVNRVRSVRLVTSGSSGNLTQVSTARRVPPTQPDNAIKSRAGGNRARQSQHHRRSEVRCCRRMISPLRRKVRELLHSVLENRIRFVQSRTFHAGYVCGHWRANRLWHIWVHPLVI